MGKPAINFLRICVFLIPFQVFSQNIGRVGLEGSRGLIIAHSSDLIPVAQTNPYGLKGSYQVLKTDHKNWEACNCFHYLGIGFSYHNFNSPDILGAAFSLSGSFEPILWRQNKWALSLESGMGVSYLTRFYDSETNPSNTFFSAPISFLMFVAPHLEYSLTPNWTLQMALNYNHISNGGQKKPNKGMNYPMLGFGIYHYLNRVELAKYTKKPMEKDLKFFVEVSYTNKNSEWATTRKPSMALTGGAYKSITGINALGFGLELNRDFSFDGENGISNDLMPAPFISHHFLFGRVDFSQRMSYYAHKPNGYNDYLFYQRYILQYKLWGKLGLAIGLKVHGHVAENVEVRLGWKF